MPVKIVFIGNVGVGKSTLIQRLRTGYAPRNTESTIGSEFITVHWNGTRFYFWDTAGSEKFNSVLPIYVRTSDAIVVCTTGDDDQRFKHFLDYFGVSENAAKKMVVVTQMDRHPETSETKKLALEHEAEYVETSAFSGLGMEELKKFLLDNFSHRDDRGGNSMGGKFARENLARESLSVGILNTLNQNTKGYCAC